MMERADYQMISPRAPGAIAATRCRVQCWVKLRPTGNRPQGPTHVRRAPESCRTRSIATIYSHRHGQLLFPGLHRLAFANHRSRYFKAASETELQLKWELHLATPFHQAATELAAPELGLFDEKRRRSCASNRRAAITATIDAKAVNLSQERLFPFTPVPNFLGQHWRNVEV